ncbi:M48 family metallopeptidase [Haloarchaeobius iranensis]|uniref:Heat shock protein. Metallo peptidase. MEROPS family M48B n=1 Tax=Haloarchaeobius iranensis TaxID=996166 RepID=A0A1G9YGY1_9EURY|nr:M48 family metalloprotease [Haloarchaeobius iranensis]SDN07806.1 Heat shock protein. Metallo peptidase. MEROPS family M48B [Haloarchaeobius iranensis]
MQHTGLKLRMAFVGTILFGFYSGLALVALSVFGTGVWPFVAVGTLLFVGVQYKIGKWAALRSVGAQDMPEDEFREIHRMVEDLSEEMEIEKPELKLARMGVPNAFATGRKGAGVVVVSTELLQVLEPDEVEAVLAHELAHIKNRDVVTMVVGQSIAAMIGIAVQWVVILAGDNAIVDWVLGWIAGMVAQMLVMVFVLAISRYREYVADADARQYVGSGDPLARALQKIQVTSESAGETRIDSSTAALCIFDSDRSFLRRVLATHPPVEKRIERLQS